VTLQNGTYQLNTQKTVTVWPKADANGDGPLVMRDVTDADGNILGIDVVKDDQGNEIHEYLPPPGFIQIPTREAGSDRLQAAYVRGDGRGNVRRNLRGEAVGIKPGTTLVEHADGTHVLLQTDWEQVLFERAHSPVSGGME
jgi:hypothetical protein